MKKLLLAALLAPAMALAQTYPSPTFSSLTLQNPLTAANGGTGATTSTGTGSAVLSNSPALVTPNLGTPSSVTLTNGTGLPVAGLTGLGSGVSSALAAAATGSGSMVLATSPSISGLTVTGGLTATGLVTTSDLATQAANTILANATSSSASPTAFAMPTCSTSSCALGYTPGTGIVANTAINAATLGGATFAAPGPIGGTTPSAAAFTNLAASGLVSGAGFSAYLASPPAIGSTSPNSGYFTSLSGSTTNPALTYTASGTGAVARNYAQKFGEWVSVKDYGATGNGSTNDTAAENAAITAACGSGSGGTVFYPPGNYVTTTGSVNVTYSNCYLVGAGANSTVITPSGTTGDLFKFNATQLDGISNMAIIYGASPTSGAAIRVTGSQAIFNAENLYIFGPLEGVLDDSSGAIHYYTNIVIYNPVASTGYGLYFTGSGNDDYLANVLVNAPSGAQPFAGLAVINNNGLWCNACEMLHAGIGMLIAPQLSTDAVMWLFVENSGFDTNSTNGIQIAPANASSVVKGLTFTGSWTSSNTSDGVNVGGAGVVDGVRFVGHRSFNNGQNGFNLLNGQNISINDSDIAGNSQSSSGTYSGIDVANAITGLSLVGNHASQEAQFGNTQSAGILINSSSQNNYQIIGNNVQQNVNYTIRDLGTGANKIISGNIGYNPIGTTGITVGASPFTYTNNTGSPIGVWIEGGTVSAVVVGGNAASASSQYYVLPQGKSIVVTYSAAPGMAYMGF